MPGRRFWSYVRSLDKLTAQAATTDINHMAAAMGTLSQESREELFAELDQRLGYKKSKPPPATLAILRGAGVNVRKG